MALVLSPNFLSSEKIKETFSFDLFRPCSLRTCCTWTLRQCRHSPMWAVQCVCVTSRGLTNVKRKADQKLPLVTAKQYNLQSTTPISERQRQRPRERIEVSIRHDGQSHLSAGRLQKNYCCWRLRCYIVDGGACLWLVVHGLDLEARSA